jgi:flagellar biosynthesis protein FliR
MTFFKVKKININEEWQKLYKKVKSNKILSVLSTFILLFINLALPIIISILVVNSDFGQRLETYQKILLVCVFFIGVALFVFAVLIIIYFIKFLYFKLKNSFGKITNYELYIRSTSKKLILKIRSISLI